ncbi:ATP-binding protein [uncultured Roseobacter sp.]|uniref:NACHT domain-containing protein n=1 Tax=uncultured Roseobacter sp. TaxID=114847 RepID=UPI002626AA82|nr:ATP-binding protein [uncultured Roseobacter sp.]
MPASPEATGGVGYTFEDSVVASYLTSLLVEGGARGISEAITDGVFLQRAALGEPLDDIVVEASDRYGQPSKLALQVKQSPTLSSADTNADFRDVISASWREFKKDGFRIGRDRVGLAAANIALSTLRAARSTLEWARTSKSADDFFRRLNTENFASDAQRRFVSDVRALLPAEAQGEENSWQFLRHFVILVFDTLSEGASGSFEAIERLRNALPTGERHRAEELWVRLSQISRHASGAAGSFSRATLVEQLSGVFDLSSLPSMRSDLVKVAEETRHALQGIRMDISGLIIPRNSILDKVNDIDDGKRFIQLAGEAGSGKSAVLRALAEEHARHGFALVLTDKRLVGPGWPSLATHLRLETERLADLLFELATLGKPTLFIDGIDRLENETRQTILDIVTILLDDPRLADWRVVASTRSSHLEDLRIWLPPQLIEEGQAHIVEIDGFDDNEAGILAERFPAMHEVLFAEGQEKEFARRPFFAQVLAQRSVSTDGAPGKFSEISLAQVWLEGPQGLHDKASSIERRQSMGELAARCAQATNRSGAIEGISAQALTALTKERAIAEVAGSGRYSFTHDIFLEWAMFGLCRQNGPDWPGTLSAAGDRPGLIRVVELLSQFEFESEDTWTETQLALEQQEAWRHWSRVWLLAPFASPAFFDRKDAISVFLSEDQRLIRLLSSFRAHKTIENLLVVHGAFGLSEKTKFEKFRIADFLSWPRPVRNWRRLLIWLLSLDWNEATIEDIVDTFDVWLNLFQDYPDKIKNRFAERLDQILAEWDAHDYWDRGKEATPLGFHKDGFGDKLRQTFIRSSLTNTDLLRERLQAWTSERIDDKIQLSVFAWSARLSSVVPDALADFSFHAFIEPLPSESAERSPGQIVGWSPHMSDWDSPGISSYSQQCHPASPLQQPFAALFEHAPQEGLRLIRELLRRTVIAWRQLPQYDFQDRAIPIPFSIEFPWGTQTFWGGQRIYGWYRGLFSCDTLGSALMALEDWAFSELESGREVDEIVRDLVSGHESVATLGIALGVVLDKDSLSPAAAALVGCQHIWVMDEYRWQHDVQGHHSNEIGASFGWSNETTHLEALKRLNSRPSRKKNIRWLATAFNLTANDQREKVIEQLSGFPNDLPFTHEGQEKDDKLVAHYRNRAQEWAAMADLSNYARVATDDGRVGVAFQPSDERVQQAEEAGERLAHWNEGFQLLKQCESWFESGKIDDQARDEIIVLAREVDNEDLFKSGFDAGDPGSRRAGGVAAVSAAILSLQPDLPHDQVKWAESVAFRAANTVPANDEFFHADAPANERPEVFAAKGLAAIIKNSGRAEKTAQAELVRLCFHPYKGVQLAALTSAASCWRGQKSFADKCTALAFKLTTLELDRGSPDWHRRRKGREKRLASEKQRLFTATIRAKAANRENTLSKTYSGIESSHLDQWRVKDFASMLSIIPKDRLADDEGFRNDLFSLVRSFVGKLATAIGIADESERRSGSRLWREFLRCIWTLARLFEDLPPEKLRSEIIPILSQLPTEPKSEVLSTFADAYSCMRLIDAREVSSDTLSVFIDIFEAVADHPDWKRPEWRDDYGLPSQLHKLVRTAMGANWDRPAMGAARFANNDWSDAGLLDPLIDWMLQRFGHLPQVMQAFLLHVERSFDHRSSEFLASRLGGIVPAVWQSRGFWSGGRTAQLAGLLQSFTERDTPLEPDVHVQFLELLDHLVELGDRRAAALQISSLFDLPRRREPPSIHSTGLGNEMPKLIPK